MRKFPYNVSKGAIHIHSTFSDGTGNIDKITKAAKKAGLDWIIITDHNTMKVKDGMYNGVFVICAEEVTPQAANHYLAFRTDCEIQADEKPEVNVEAVRFHGGFGFQAHPDESSMRKNNVKPLKWTNKELTGDGIELWNRFSDWADSLDETDFFTLAYAYIFRENLIKGPKKDTLRYWDAVNNEVEYIYPALGGVDAHALKIKKYGITVTIFPYSYFFNTVTNIICLKDEISGSIEEKKKSILNAIESGNNIIIDRKRSRVIPEIYIQNTRITAAPGDKITKDNNTVLYVNSKKKCEIKVFLNGVLISETKSKSLEYKITEKGKYRIELSLNGRPWVFSNPVKVN